MARARVKTLAGCSHTCEGFLSLRVEPSSCRIFTELYALFFFEIWWNFYVVVWVRNFFFSRPFKPLPSRTRCESGNGSEWASADAPDVLCDRWAWLVSHVGGDLHAKGKKQKNKTKTKKTGDSDLLTVVSYDIVWKPYCSTVVGVPGCFFFSYVNMCDVTIVQPSCQNKYWQIGICITKIS